MLALCCQLLFCPLVNEEEGAPTCNPAVTSPVESARPHVDENSIMVETFEDVWGAYFHVSVYFVRQIYNLRIKRIGEGVKMPNFAANLSMMFMEVEFTERFKVASDSGFKAVEYLFPYDYAKDQLVNLLRENDLLQDSHL